MHLLTFYKCFFFFFSQGEESNAAASKCQLKVAAFAAQLANYERAIQIYEEVRDL